MKTILLIILALIILFPNMKRIYKIVTTEGFLKAFIFYNIYGTVVWIIAKILDLLVSRETTIGSILFFILWIVAIIIYYNLGKSDPKLYLPLYFMLSIGTLGLALLFIYAKVTLLNNNNSNNNSSTFVDPNQVSGYNRQDGTYVQPYWRDGDGNTSINLTKEQGGGYFRRK